MAEDPSRKFDTTDDDDSDEDEDVTDGFRYMPLEEADPAPDQSNMESNHNQTMLDNSVGRLAGPNGNPSSGYTSSACDSSDIEVIQESSDSIEVLDYKVDNNPYVLSLNEHDSNIVFHSNQNVERLKQTHSDCDSLPDRDLDTPDALAKPIDSLHGDSAHDSLSSDTPTLKSSSSTSGSNSNMMSDEGPCAQASSPRPPLKGHVMPNLEAEAREIFAAIDALDRERCDQSDSPGSSSISHSPYDSPIHRPGVPLEPNVITYENGVSGRPDSLSLPRPLQYYERRRLMKKDSSASSLSEFSSRSSSMDALIEAATSTPLQSQGIVTTEGDMVAFVASGLDQMIRMSSPHSRRDSSGASYSGNQTPRSVTSLSSSASGWSTSSASGWSYSGLSRSPSVLTQSPDDVPPIDPRALMDLEVHARHVATSLDRMMATLKTNLFKMSSITYNCLDAYKDGIDQTCDSVDNSIKSMYALMAKCEELSTRMRPIYQLQKEIQEISRLLDLFEAQMAHEEKKV